MKNVEMFTISNISPERPVFISAALNEYTDRIFKITSNAMTYAEQKNREIACILGEVADTGAYKEDGFKSVADYANTVFGIKRQNAFALARAGKVYNDPEASPVLKSMSPSKLNELDRVEPEKVIEAINSGIITEDTTQKDLREFASDNATTKDDSPEVVEEYKAWPCLPVIPNDLADKVNDPNTVEEWDRFFLNYVSMIGDIVHAAEAIKLPNAKLNPDDKKATITRKLYISRTYSLAVEFYKAAPEKSPKPKKSGNGKFTREELVAMLAELDKES